MGTVSRTSEKGDSEVVALPLAYALLSSKETAQYEIVLRSISAAALSYGIKDFGPKLIMCDFELAIINASKAVYPYVAISACFFHLSQNLYRNIQVQGLQAAYNDPNDRSIKTYTHMLAALAFVPICDVECYFSALAAEAPDDLSDFVNYFDKTYVTGEFYTFTSMFLTTVCYFE